MPQLTKRILGNNLNHLLLPCRTELEKVETFLSIPHLISKDNFFFNETKVSFQIQRRQDLVFSQFGFQIDPFNATFALLLSVAEGQRPRSYLSCYSSFLFNTHWADFFVFKFSYNWLQLIEAIPKGLLLVDGTWDIGIVDMDQTNFRRYIMYRLNTVR